MRTLDFSSLFLAVGFLLMVAGVYLHYGAATSCIAGGAGLFGIGVLAVRSEAR